MSAQCSATCGLGNACKTRHCFSQQTKKRVSDVSCTSLDLKTFFEQCKTCKLEECPGQSLPSRRIIF